MSRSRKPTYTSPSHIKKSIPVIYQNNFIELTIWMWICAQINKNVSTHKDDLKDLQSSLTRKQTSITDACISYRSFFRLTEDDLPLGTMYMIYNRKNAEFKAIVRSEGRPLAITDDIYRASTDVILESVIELVTRQGAILEKLTKNN